MFGFHFIYFSSFLQHLFQVTRRALFTRANLIKHVLLTRLAPWKRKKVPQEVNGQRQAGFHQIKPHYWKHNWKNPFWKNIEYEGADTFCRDLNESLNSHCHSTYFIVDLPAASTLESIVFFFIFNCFLMSPFLIIALWETETSFISSGGSVGGGFFGTFRKLIKHSAWKVSVSPSGHILKVNVLSVCMKSRFLFVLVCFFASHPLGRTRVLTKLFLLRGDVIY